MFRCIDSRRARTSSSYIRTAARRSAITADLCCTVCCIRASNVKVSSILLTVEIARIRFRTYRVPIRAVVVLKSWFADLIMAILIVTL